ncbi:hypothetical protein [Stenotrophomonas sp.]|nr:hypothetical protein [Stenotrophomonas sp.]
MPLRTAYCVLGNTWVTFAPVSSWALVCSVLIVTGIRNARV